MALKLPHIMLKAAAALRHCTLDINTLMTIAVAGDALGRQSNARAGHAPTPKAMRNMS